MDTKLLWKTHIDEMERKVKEDFFRLQLGRLTMFLSSRLFTYASRGMLAY
jgi:hypothetical protein